MSKGVSIDRLDSTSSSAYWQEDSGISQLKSTFLSMTIHYSAWIRANLSCRVIFIFLFVFGYAWQGCVWLYCSEIAPLEYRHIGGAATAFGEWLMTFITVFAGPIGLTNVGWKFWLWVLSGNVTAILFV